MAVRDYDGMLATLSDLIRFKNKADAITWRDAFENMDVYLERIGILEDLSKLSIIHVAGTKGKGSTCAMAESVLRTCGYRTGLYTSPHLVDVRERIRINGLMVDKAEFERHFWFCYDKLHAAATPEVGVPGYFRFMTLLAFKIFLASGVDVVMLEVGLGGRLDATNCVKRPEVTGITSLGMDHMAELGDTLAKIAREKAGIMKEGRPAFTSPQLEEAMAVLKEVSSTVGAPLTEVSPLTAVQSPPTAALGDHMLINAALAVQLCRTWEAGASGAAAARASAAAAGAAARLRQLEAGELPQEYSDGLASVRWPGRSQVVADSGETNPEGAGAGDATTEGAGAAGDRLVFYIDGAHTQESMATCAEWFAEQSQADGAKSGVDTADVRRVLLFNCMKERDPDLLLPILARGLAARGVHFHQGLFVPSESIYGFLPTKAKPHPDSVPPTSAAASAHVTLPHSSSPEPDLLWQMGMQACWEGQGLGRAAPHCRGVPPLPTAGLACLKAELAPGGSAVMPSLSGTLDWLRAYARSDPKRQVQVLVTGSLYLVGDVLRLLGKAPK